MIQIIGGWTILVKHIVVDVSLKDKLAFGRGRWNEFGIFGIRALYRSLLVIEVTYSKNYFFR